MLDNRPDRHEDVGGIQKKDKMRTTGKFDKSGKEILEGDKVIKVWGWFTYKGNHKDRYQIHTITVRDAHMMANGEMHDDGDGKIFCLGNAYNFWGGESVLKLTDKEVEGICIPEDMDFFFDEYGKAIIFNDQHFLGLSDEEMEKYKAKMLENERKWLWGV